MLKKNVLYKKIITCRCYYCDIKINKGNACHDCLEKIVFNKKAKK